MRVLSELSLLVGETPTDGDSAMGAGASALCCYSGNQRLDVAKRKCKSLFV